MTRLYGATSGLLQEEAGPGLDFRLHMNSKVGFVNIIR